MGSGLPFGPGLDPPRLHHDFEATWRSFFSAEKYDAAKYLKYMEKALSVDFWRL